MKEVWRNIGRGERGGRRGEGIRGKREEKETFEAESAQNSRKTLSSKKPRRITSNNPSYIFERKRERKGKCEW